LIPRNVSTLLLAALAPLTSAQLDPELAARVLEVADRSPFVAARKLTLEEAKAAARALGAPANPELEIAPGIGFTNSNFLIGQSFDISGLRAARARRARAEADIAHAEWIAARRSASLAVLLAVAELRAAIGHANSARAAVENAQAIATAVQKRVEVGEAPEVQSIRAEIERNRAELAHRAAAREVETASANLISLAGNTPSAGISSLNWKGIEMSAEAERTFLDRHPAYRYAEARIEAARAGELEAKRQGRPSLFAGFATDTWSFDRRPFDNRNLGLQVRLSMPLLDRGENRESIRAAELARRSRESELEEARRALKLELEVARAELTSAQAASKTYSTQLLPKAQELINRLRTAFEAGLTSYLEVLEAQKALSQLLSEEAVARRELVRAEVRYLGAANLIPGLEMSR